MINSFTQSAKFNFSQYNDAVLNSLNSKNIEELTSAREQLEEEQETLLSDLEIINERVSKGSTLFQLDSSILTNIKSLKATAYELTKVLQKSGFDIKTRSELIRRWKQNELKQVVFDDFDSLSDAVSEKGYLIREQIKSTTTIGYNSFLLYSVIFFVFVLAVFSLISINVLKPIKKMTSDFDVIAKGHYEMEVEVLDELTEMGKLASSFNILLSNFHNSLLQVKHASKSKDQFMANISHELRTPLNAILGFSKLLLEDPKIRNSGSENVEAIQEIFHSGKHLLALINDILDYNKIQSSNFEINPEPVRMRSIFKSSLSLVRGKAEQKEIELKLVDNLDKDLVLNIDELRIKQVLINLLNNAIKFTEEGSVILRINSDLSDSPNKIKVKFEVEDSGIGMSPEGLKKIFEFYGQAEISTQKDYGGTGLGLPISKSLVEKMGGEILVESSLGKGSCFSFTLVLDKMPSHLAPVEVQPFSSSVEKLNNSELKILLAEDNLVNQKVFKAMLNSLGVKNIEIAENGKEAIEKVMHSRFDLIFMDMQMPVMGGVESSKKIIEHLKDDCPPIIAITANDFQEDRDSCSEAGMQGYLTKPLELEILSSTISHFLGAAIVNQDASDNISSKKGKVLNLQRIEELLGFDKEIVHKLLNLFILDSTEVLKALHSSKEKNDFKSISAHAHRLRGSLINLGGDYAAHIAERIEMGEGDLSLNIKRLEKGIIQFKEEYQEHLANIS
ncbi:MAG: signal transduction histidine kinase/DNA-binding response OmpR family regulator [Bacteriovoracaceae bacterium]|jgi:signal transduction histidine kinase/DNA-binding response OmpR family regulator